MPNSFLHIENIIKGVYQKIMAVKIYKIGEDEENGRPVDAAEDLATGEDVPCKNWFEKSKNKWHCVLGPNSANRKYVSHNEIASKLGEDGDGEYIVEDKTSGPRSLGTAQPDKKLIPYMTEEEKDDYDAIIARAMARRDEEKASKKALSEEEKLEAQIEKLQKKLALKRAVAEAGTVEEE